MFTDFNLSEGCFGTDIIRKYKKWSQMGVHGLKIGQAFAKIQCMSSVVRKKHKRTQHMLNILEYDYKL